MTFIILDLQHVNQGYNQDEAKACTSTTTIDRGS